MRPDEFARRTLARLRGEVAPLAAEDRMLLEQTHTQPLIYKDGGVVISDDMSAEGIASVRAVLKRQYGLLEHLIWLPTVEAEG